jgi:hypothetical protein
VGSLLARILKGMTAVAAAAAAAAAARKARKNVVYGNYCYGLSPGAAAQ